MGRKTLLISLILLCLFLMPRSASNAARLQSARFYGYATLDGHAVPSHSPISAWIAGQKVAEGPSFPFAGRSLFAFQVPVENPLHDGREGGREGDVVTFQVGDAVAEETAIWHAGANQEVSINAVTPPPRPMKVRFEGEISSITTVPETGDEVWMVAGVEVIITEDTIVAPQGYQAAVGDWAKVKAVRGIDGTIVAEYVDIRISAIEASNFEFRGPIESIEETSLASEIELVVGGTRVLADDNTEIIGDLVVGYVAEVAGELRADGVVLAHRIATLSPEDAETSVEFKGEIKGINADWWLVEWEDATVTVWKTEAQIEGTPFVTLLAAVRGFRRGDGSVNATMIRVEEPNPIDEVHFSGTVVSLSQDVWVVRTEAGDKTVHIDFYTFIDESRAPALEDNIAHVTAKQQPDQSFLAFRIRLERPG